VRSTLSDILSFIVGNVFPPDATKLKLPASAYLLYRIRTGEIAVVQTGEQGVALPAREWNGKQWVLPN
jgi:hypothetical protein